MRLKKLLTFAATCMACLSVFSQNANPFESIGKQGKILSLSKGRYDELFDQDSIQQIGTALVNVHQMKVVGLLSEQEAQKRLDNSSNSRFLSVDPLSGSYPELTPYQYASNTPIWAVDIDGLEGGLYGGFNLSAAEETARAYERGTDAAIKYFNSPASWAEKQGLAYQINSNQAGVNFSAADFSGLTKGQYYLKSLGQSLFKFAQDQPGNLRMPSAHVPQQPHAEVEVHVSTPKLRTSSHEEIPATTTNNQSVAANSHNSNSKLSNTASAQKITVKETDPQVGAHFGAKNYDIVNGKIMMNKQGASGTFDFVVTNEGKLVIGNGHYNLSGNAKTVQAAGRLIIDNGQVKTINNRSGHYQPNTEEAQSFGDIIKNTGVGTSGAQLNIYNRSGQRVSAVKL